LRNISFNYLNRFECNFNRKCILFFHSVHWNGGSLVIMWIVFLLGSGLFVFQVKELFKIRNFTEKSTDLVAPLYTMTWFSAVDFLVSAWLSYTSPALWIWPERTLLSLTPIVVFVHFMWIGWYRRHRVYWRMLKRDFFCFRYFFVCLSFFSFFLLLINILSMF
jgi:hypothetical protein